MIQTAWHLYLVIGALAAALIGAAVLARWPSLVAVIAGTYAAIAWDVPLVPPITTVMGTSIYFLDYVSVVVFSISFPRLWRIRAAAPLFVTCWFALLGLLSLSLIRGLASNSIGPAVNDFRSFLYVIAVLQWALTLDWTPDRTRQLIEHGSQLLGWVLVAVFALHVMIRGLGSADESILDPVTGALSSSRPLNSGQALVLALCAVLCFSNWLFSRRPWLLASSLVFFLCVVLAQNRSAWAAAAGAFVGLVATARLGGRMRLVTVLGIVTLTATLLISTNALGDVYGNLAESLNSSGTYKAREDSWTSLIGQQFASGDPLRILAGSAMGDGYDRVESSGRLVQYAPHNWYVTVFLRTGILGLLAFVTMMIVLFVRSLRCREAPFAALVAALLLYGWAYSWNWYSMIFLGWAASQALGLYCVGHACLMSRLHATPNDAPRIG